MTVSTDIPEEDRINQVISDFAEPLDEANLALVIESAGVAQAINALRKALDNVEQCLNDRKYEEVASLGYGDICSEFIFLQRTMGAIHSKALERSSVVSEIACEAKVAFEKVERLVRKWSQSRG